MKRDKFKRLIKKYEISIQLRYEEKGNYVDGEYISGAITFEHKKIAMFPLSQQKIYDLGGSYTTEDFQAITLEEISLEKSPHVYYKEKLYKLEPDGSYDNYADVYNYIMKRVDNFDRPKTDDSCFNRRAKTDS